MKLNNGTEIDDYSIQQLILIRDELLEKRLQKLGDIEQKQSEILKLQANVMEMQKEAISSGNDIIAITEKLKDTVDKARVNN